jgi:hypothetical protein
MKKALFAGLLLLGLTVPSFSVTEKWVAGAVSSWTPLCGTEVNSLASSSSASNAVQCSTIVGNATNLDLYMKVSVSLGSVASGAGSPYVGIYIYPLNQDGTTYGDGAFATTAVGPPATNYMGCSIPAPASVTAAITGSCYTGIPPTNFKVVFFNNLLVNMASGSNVVDYQTFNRQAN